MDGQKTVSEREAKRGGGRAGQRRPESERAAGGKETEADWWTGWLLAAGWATNLL